MKTEDQAWRELRRHAAAQLRPDFAHRVMQASQGPKPAAWKTLETYAAAQLRPGFAERVLRAARAFPRMPSLAGQFALSAVTTALCLLAVVFAHSRATQLQDQRNLARWQQLADEAQEADLGQ